MGAGSCPQSPVLDEKKKERKNKRTGEVAKGKRERERASERVGKGGRNVDERSVRTTTRAIKRCYTMRRGGGGKKKKGARSLGLREYGHIVDQQWCSAKFLDS